MPPFSPSHLFSYGPLGTIRKYQPWILWMMFLHVFTFVYHVPYIGVLPNDVWSGLASSLASTDGFKLSRLLFKPHGLWY